MKNILRSAITVSLLPLIFTFNNANASYYGHSNNYSRSSYQDYSRSSYQASYRNSYQSIVSLFNSNSYGRSYNNSYARSSQNSSWRSYDNSYERSYQHSSWDSYEDSYDDSSSDSVIIAEQDFSSYSVRRGWALYDDSYDLATMIEDGDTRREAKAKFVDNGELMFDARWTQKTLKLMYPDVWPEALANGATESKISERKQTIADIRAQACDVKIEVGKASVYGVNDEGYRGNVSELDTDASHCYDVADNTLGTIALRSFIPTVPGAEYEVEVKYRKREYNWYAAGAESEEQAYKDLILRIGADRYQLTLDTNLSDSTLDEGFIVATRTFTADKFFTKLNLKDNGYPDGYGVLIRAVKVTQLSENPNEETCNSYYSPYSGALKNCLLSESDPELLGCDLSQSKLTWTQGENVQLGADYRSNLGNVFYSDDNRTFLSLGKAGNLKIQLQENEVNAACVVTDKTLALDEVTWSEDTYEEYAEKGVVKVKLVGCTNEDDNGWSLLSNDITDNNLLVTNESFSHTFSGVNAKDGCAITAIRIKDKTDKIPSTQAGYVWNSDGIDVNSLTLTEN